ncbi:MAG: hypothetical protein ABJB40_02300 [Acidobacteriota bacterium]
MRTPLYVFVVVLATIVSSVQIASAQFPIKIPKLPKTEKPKQEQPKSDDKSSSQQATPNDSSEVKSKQTSAAQNSSATSQVRSFERPTPPSSPLFLINTLEIKLKGQDKYWKFPNQIYYSNWVPQVRFEVFYDNNERSRYTAEWHKPDGTLWFTESLDARENSDGVVMTSLYNGSLFDTASTDQTGAYGLKVTNNKTKEVVFQGKFNVKKSIDTPGDARMKNAFQFFVDNDWHLAVGYAGINEDGWSTAGNEPRVLLWFKGVPERKDMEARLFYNNQEITSTDDGGIISEELRRGDDCVRGQEICRYVMYLFRWDKFKIASQYNFRDPNVIFTRDKPGEYTIKVFYKGAQVREAKFTIAPDGMVPRNSFSNNIFPSLSIIPIKVMGTSEKWNPISWKTEMFYGNPIVGFNVP